MAALRAVGLLWRTLGNPAICVRPVALRPLLAESLPCQWVPTRPMLALVHDVRVRRRDGADRTTVEQRDVSNQGYRCGDDSYRRLRLRSHIVRTPGRQSGTATAVDRDQRSEACRAAGRVSLAVRRSLMGSPPASTRAAVEEARRPLAVTAPPLPVTSITAGMDFSLVAVRWGWSVGRGTCA
jgi:hypothetical protein